MDAFGLLAEGVSVAAGGGAKVDGDHDHERSLRLQLVVVVLLDRENTALQERFDEAASPVTSNTTGEKHQQGTSLVSRRMYGTTPPYTVWRLNCERDAAFVSCHKRCFFFKKEQKRQACSGCL